MAHFVWQASYFFSCMYTSILFTGYPASDFNKPIAHLRGLVVHWGYVYLCCDIYINTVKLLQGFLL